MPATWVIPTVNEVGGVVLGVLVLDEGGLFDGFEPDWPPDAVLGGWAENAAERLPPPHPKLIRRHKQTRQTVTLRTAKAPLYDPQRVRTHSTYRLEPENAPNAVPETRQECPVRKPD
ncbi:MAG: hypothetical protein JOZ80_06140 [Acidobacteriaceae bacterium]|nr:hypothetical protein [Acidobacteriaceae bacterium]